MTDDMMNIVESLMDDGHPMDSLLVELRELNDKMDALKEQVESVRFDILQYVERNGAFNTDVAMVSVTKPVNTVSYDKKVVDMTLALLKSLSVSNEAFIPVRDMLEGGRSESKRDGSLRIKFL